MKSVFAECKLLVQMEVSMTEKAKQGPGKGLYLRDASGLVRELSALDVFIFALAAPAASGITKYAVSRASEFPGANMALAFVIGLLLFWPLRIVIGYVSAAAPRSGGMYVITSRVLPPWIGFATATLYVVGWSFIAGILGNIVFGIVGGMFATTGGVQHSSELLQIGAMLQGSSLKLVGGTVLVMALGLMISSHIEIIKKAMRWIFVVPLAGTAVILVYLIATTGQGASHAFDHNWGEGTFRRVIETASQLGWTGQKFSLSETLKALQVVIWAYLGFELVSFASGEVRDPEKTMIKGFRAGWLGVGLLYIIVAATVYAAFGNFIGAYDFLYDRQREALSSIMTPVDPSLAFYFSSIVANKWIAIVVTLSLVLWYINTIPPIILAVGNIIYEFTMEHLLPGQLIPSAGSRLPAKFWAVFITSMLSAIGVFVGLKFDELGVINAIILPMFVIFSLAVIILPVRRPHIFEKCPQSSKRMIFGKPAIVVFGIASFVLSIAAFIISVWTLQVGAWVVIGTVFAAVLIGWMIASRRQLRVLKRVGVPREVMYEHVPPDEFGVTF